MNKQIVPQHLDLTADESALYERYYRMGYRHAEGIAHCNVPKVGGRINRSVDYIGFDPVVTVENAKEYHEMLCYAAEQHSREYSPFEYIAKEINDDEVLGSEMGWDAFDSGVADCIGKAMSLYSDEDYK
jgi:hypothetical protein